MGRKPAVLAGPFDPPRKRGRPAKTLEGRENQLIALAYDVAEEQMRQGIASSQVITEFLKRGSTKDQLEKERLRQEVSLTEAKIEAMKSAQTTEELYSKALDAMRTYTGISTELYEE